jgi:hypothetical protein
VRVEVAFRLQFLRRALCVWLMLGGKLPFDYSPFYRKTWNTFAAYASAL